MTLNALAAQVHQTAVSHGFWGPFLLPDVDEQLYLVPRALCLIHSEVSEALEAHRELSACPGNGEPARTETVGEELIDVLVRTLDLLAYLEVDVDAEMARKMERNSRRPYKHGGKAY